jgi:peroxiredoxin
MGASSSYAQTPTVGDLAPDFTLEQLDGTIRSLSDFRGKVIFINFFGYN